MWKTNTNWHTIVNVTKCGVQGVGILCKPLHSLKDSLMARHNAPCSPDIPYVAMSIRAHHLTRTHNSLEPIIKPHTLCVETFRWEIATAQLNFCDPLVGIHPEQLHNVTSPCLVTCAVVKTKISPRPQYTETMKTSENTSTTTAARDGALNNVMQKAPCLSRCIGSHLCVSAVCFGV